MKGKRKKQKEKGKTEKETGGGMDLGG